MYIESHNSEQAAPSSTDIQKTVIGCEVVVGQLEFNSV